MWECFEDESYLRVSSKHAYRLPCACLERTMRGNPRYVYSAIRGVLVGPFLVLPSLGLGFLWDLARGPGAPGPQGLGWKVKTLVGAALQVVDEGSDVVVTIDYYQREEWSYYGFSLTCPLNGSVARLDSAVCHKCKRFRTLRTAW